MNSMQMLLPLPSSSALILIAWIGVAMVAVHCQTDSCDSAFITFLPHPFNASGLNCRPMWKTFILRYSQDREANTMSMLLSAVYTSGWVGIGFSSDGMMVGSSAMVGWIDGEGRARIKQYYLRGRTSSQVVADEGELLESRLSPAAVVLYGENIYLAFQLKLSSMLLSEHKWLLFASSSAAPNQFFLTQHDDKASLPFDFSVGTAAAAAAAGTGTADSYTNQLKRNHGALVILGWGVMTPVGAIIARYCRQWEALWFYLHLIIQFGGFLTGFAGVMAGISLQHKLHSNVTLHRGIGISVLVLGVLQVIAFFVRPEKESKIRKYWNWYHNWVGRLLLLLAAFNIALGIQVGAAGISWRIVYGIVLSSILMVVAFLETIRCTKLFQKDAEANSAFF